ncbi:MAG TPA: hypothetical protein VKE22_17575 [Haliangiales bacterium]|nr:hypothetical protein [Haliangiales bacterium]
MTTLSEREMVELSGGGDRCYGIWIGTFDGKYGVCLGFQTNT